MPAVLQGTEADCVGSVLVVCTVGVGAISYYIHKPNTYHIMLYYIALYYIRLYYIISYYILFYYILINCIVLMAIS